MSDNIAMESFAQLYEESIAKSIYPGATLMATVVAVTPEYVTVNAGLKSESHIPIKQFLDNQGNVEVKAGEEVEVVLDAIEDGRGYTRLSREKAKRGQAWEALALAQTNNDTVVGIIINRVKGGFTVELGTIKAFLPGSLVDFRPVKDLDELEGQRCEFKIVSIDQKRNNVIVSRRAILEESANIEKQAILNNFIEGQEVIGVVKNLTDYGAFIDLGGVDGLLYITDISWKRIRHPSEVIEIGQELKVKILAFDREKNRVSLGLKQLSSDPWQDLVDRYPVGSKLTGKVSNVTDYGCFVNIEEGVEGLVHVSEMDWTNKNIQPSKIVEVGQEIEVVVLDIDGNRRRISLGLKQCGANPWSEFAAKYNKNDKVSGAIKSITDFGVFVGLDGNIDGLVHISDLSWGDDEEKAQKLREYKRGDEIEAIILSIDPERERISLGIKQMEQDSFAAYTSNHGKGSIVSGQVLEIAPKALRIGLTQDGVEGILKISEFSRDKLDSFAGIVNIGDVIESKIISVDKKQRVIGLSVRAKDLQEEKDALKRLNEDHDESNTMLGDLLKEQISRNAEG